MDNIRAIKGMLDIPPHEAVTWQYIEEQFTSIARQYGYLETRMPIVESTSLFKRSIGEVTDIVEKEMYTFADRNDGSLTLRPEGTAGCVRSLIEQGNANGRSQHKLWYSGPMFRYEKPQKGRQRQFHQIGVESFGFANAEAEAELLAMTARLWKKLGVDSAVSLELNSIGTSEERQAFKQALVAFLEDKKAQLDEDSQRRLNTNPMRILDSKVESTQALLADAPELNAFLGDETRAHFDRLKYLLDGLGIEYTINPKLVRGLDYYNYSVFEWTTDKLGAQGTVCAGGRYDKLVEQLGGKPTAGVGFAMGIERLVLLLEAVAKDSIASLKPIPAACIAAVGEAAQAFALTVAEQLHDSCPDVYIETILTGGSFKSQMKKLDKSGSELALIIAETEVEQQQVAVKWLRDRSKEQQLMSLDQVVSLINSNEEG